MLAGLMTETARPETVTETEQPALSSEEQNLPDQIYEHIVAPMPTPTSSPTQVAQATQATLTTSSMEPKDDFVCKHCARTFQS